MNTLRLVITACLLALLSTSVRGDDVAKWEYPKDKKFFAFPTRVKPGTRQLNAILSESTTQPNSCSVRFQFDFDNLLVDKERIEVAHPGWSVQRLAPTEITFRAEFVAEEKNGELRSICNLMPNDISKPNSITLNENGLQVSMVVKDEKSTADVKDSAAHQLFERLQLNDPKVQLHLTLALKKDSQTTASYSVDTAKLVEALGNASFEAAEINKAFKAAVKWEKGSNSEAAEAEVTKRLVNSLKLLEQLLDQPTESKDEPNDPPPMFALTDRCKNGAKLKLVLKDSFTITIPAEEQQFVYRLNDWNKVTKNGNILNRSEKPADPKPADPKPADPKPAVPKPGNLDQTESKAKDQWEIFCGPKGVNDSRGALPLRLSIDTSRDLGFRLAKYSMTDDRTDDQLDSSFPAPLQGGYLQFRLPAPKPPEDLGERVVPATLAWSAVEIRLGPKVSVRKLTFDNPSQLAFFVDAKLSRAEVDTLWNPIEVNLPDGQKRRSNSAKHPLIRSHAVAHDHVLISDKAAVSFRADRLAFFDSCRAWIERTHDSKKGDEQQAGIPCSTEAQIESFVDYCIDQPEVFPKLTPRPSSSDQKLALFTQLRQAWLRYELHDGLEANWFRLFAQPLEVQSGLASTLERTLQGWSIVERYRYLETNSDEADWELDEIYVHGYEREMEQRVHFWPIGDWNSQGIQSVGIEASFTDSQSGFTKSQRFLVPVNEPYSWQFKSRYSEQLKLRWRVYACRMQDGRVKTAPRPAPWITKDQASVFDEFVYLDTTAASSLLQSKSGS